MTSVGDYLQFEHGGRTRRFGWTGPWPPPERLALVIGGETGQAAVAEEGARLTDALAQPGGSALTVVWCGRVSHSSLPPQEAGSHVARGALYRPEATP